MAAQLLLECRNGNEMHAMHVSIRQALLVYGAAVFLTCM